MVRISDTDIGRRVGGDVGNDIIVDLAVIRIQAHIYFDVGIDLLDLLHIASQLAIVTGQVRAVIDKVDAELFGLFSENNWTK